MQNELKIIYRILRRFFTDAENVISMNTPGLDRRELDDVQNPEVIRGDTRNYDGDIDAYMDVLLGIKNEKCGNIKNEKNN